ncbi:TrbI/VirB10 family protein [Rhodanobacter sp. 115]|uniref:TrbI/VirB10 family protein n=1 Tax=Rhodanobacter sp. FW021-MT20 TaxID=1162282 RepID=UPI0034E45853
MSGPATKPPVNRKVAIYIVAMIGALVLISVLVAVTKNNPQRQRAIAKAAAERAAVKALPAGTEQGGKEAITRGLNSFDAKSLYASPIGSLGTGSNESSPSSKKQGTDALPPVDANTLAQLDQAFKAASKPDAGTSGIVGSGGLASGVVGGSLPAASVGGSKTPPGTYEAYPGQKPGAVMNAAQATGMEPTAPAADASQKRSLTYPVVEPLSAPDGMLIAKGTLIRAVLSTKIDTRNAGNVTATVTQDVYDSLRQSQLLIPKGSRLLGSYGTKVSPGLPRIPVQFTRLELPDGRIVDLGKADAVNYAGATGIDGKYHSNILRALGPSLVVALIGTAVDNMQKPKNTATSAAGTTVQSPSVAEQLAPQVNSEVMSRYSAAQPYFIVNAGTQFKVEMQSDVVIPGGATPRYPTYGETNPVAKQAAQGASDTHQSGVWEAGVSAQ